eukprot:9503882-Pyramimonas_sp.AAC.1
MTWPTQRPITTQRERLVVGLVTGHQFNSPTDSLRRSHYGRRTPVSSPNGLVRIKVRRIGGD